MKLNNMPYEIISTGSKGNCIIFNHNIMLDCGISYTKVKPYLKDMDLIFISHRHSDHLNGTTIKQISYNYPTIKFVCNIEVASFLELLGVQKKNIWLLYEGRWYDIGFAKIKLDKLVHDAHNSSFQIEYRKKYKMIYITDTGSIPEYIDAKNYDLYLVEANYKSKEEYEQKIKEALEKGEYTYLVRAIETHLCEEDAIDWLKQNMSDESQFQFIHMHEEKESEVEYGH